MLRLWCGGAVAICRKRPPHARLRAGHPAGLQFSTHFSDACAIGADCAPSYFATPLTATFGTVCSAWAASNAQTHWTIRRYNQTGVPQYHHRAWAKKQMFVMLACLLVDGFQRVHILEMPKKDRRPTPASSAICFAVGDKLPFSSSVSVAVIIAARVCALRLRRPSILSICASSFIMICLVRPVDKLIVKCRLITQ